MLEHLGRRPLKANAPAIDDQQHVGEFRQQRDLLLHHHDRGAVFARIAGQKLEHRQRRRRVELGRRLVKHQHARLQRDDRSHRHLLLLPAGKLVDAAMAQIGDAHRLKRLSHAALDLVLRHAEILQPVEDLVLHHR